MRKALALAGAPPICGRMRRTVPGLARRMSAAETSSLTPGNGCARAAVGARASTASTIDKPILMERTEREATRIRHDRYWGPRLRYRGRRSAVCRYDATGCTPSVAGLPGLAAAIGRGWPRKRSAIQATASSALSYPAKLCDTPSSIFISTTDAGFAQPVGELDGDLRPHQIVGRALRDENRCAGRRLARRVAVHDPAPRLDGGRIDLEEGALQRLLDLLEAQKLGDLFDARSGNRLEGAVWRWARAPGRAEC